VTAPHFFVDSLEEAAVRLNQDDTRHALRSLRLRPGEEVTLADGEGTMALGTLRGDDGGVAVVDVAARWHAPRPAPVVGVVLAAPKGDRLTWAIRRLTEVGVDETVVMTAQRSLRAWEAERSERGADRLHRSAREAAMQSRQPFVMRVRAGATFAEAIRSESPETTIVLWEEASARLSNVLPAQPEAVRLLVGPEGSFSGREIEAAVQAGTRLASLGAPVLRTETAAVVGAALVLHRYGRLG